MEKPYMRKNGKKVGKVVEETTVDR
jgi:hypothetical protein